MPLDATNYSFFNDDEILIALRNTRDGIARAWCQGRWSDGAGMCALARLTQTCRTSDLAYYIKNHILEPLIHMSLDVYNDTHERTDVLKLFDLAIERIEAVVLDEAIG